MKERYTRTVTCDVEAAGKIACTISGSLNPFLMSERHGETIRIRPILSDDPRAVIDLTERQWALLVKASEDSAVTERFGLRVIE